MAEELGRDLHRGDMAQSAPSDVADTEEACGWPLQNSRPALTHFDGGGGRRYGGGASLGFLDSERSANAAGTFASGGGGTRGEVGVWVAVGVCVWRSCVGAGGRPAKMTRPPWSHSISQSAETVTSAATNG